jgi:hypothetical protein
MEYLPVGVLPQLIIPEWCQSELALFAPAAFERYRIAGCEGVFMKGYTVRGIGKQMDIPRKNGRKVARRSLPGLGFKALLHGSNQRPTAEAVFGMLASLRNEG